MPEATPPQDYPLHIDLDAGTIFDGGADDNYFLLPFDEVDLYCEKKYGVYLELPQFTNGRAEQMIAYIRTALMQSDSVEIGMSGSRAIGNLMIGPISVNEPFLLTN